jgi:hypothetical protein
MVPDIFVQNLILENPTEKNIRIFISAGKWGVSPTKQTHVVVKTVLTHEEAEWMTGSIPIFQRFNLDWYFKIDIFQELAWAPFHSHVLLKFSNIIFLLLFLVHTH